MKTFKKKLFYVLWGLILLELTIFGYLIRLPVSQFFNNGMLSEPILIIIGRLGLIGYIILFFAWERLQPYNNKYLKLGNMKEVLKVPFVWWGFKEYVWRFTLIFCSLWLITAVIFSLNGNVFEVLWHGLLFAAINSILEGILWRGLILGRIVEYMGEKRGLVLSSIVFGLYHLSLGFSIWICLLFAVGGLYMGGLAIKSKGLFAPIIMQFFVNIAFVSFGMIF